MITTVCGAPCAKACSPARPAITRIAAKDAMKCCKLFLLIARRPLRARLNLFNELGKRLGVVICDLTAIGGIIPLAHFIGGIGRRSLKPVAVEIDHIAV
jgi:hypothetical protein